MISYFGSLSVATQLLISYLVVINLITFFFYWADKQKSYGSSRRISEKTLWLLALLGGTIGALAAMKLFRHKTKKTSFQLVFALIIAIQLALGIYIASTINS